MGIDAYVSGYTFVDYHTEAANTVIDEAIQGVDGKRLVVNAFEYLAAATAHDISIMHPGSAAGSRTTASAAAAAAQKDLICTTAPVDPAGNAVANLDILAYKITGGAWEFNIAASLAASTITMTTNIAVIVPILAPIRIFGVIADGAVQTIHCLASVVTSGADGIYAANPYKGDPSYVSVDNATNAGFLNRMVFAHINK